MAAISIRERMNPDQPMMKPDREFIRLECLMVDPITEIAQQSRKRLPYVVVRKADVLLRAPVPSSPPPCLVKHAPVQLSHVVLSEGILPLKISRVKCPAVGFENILALPLVEFFLRCEIRDEVVLFLGR